MAQNSEVASYSAGSKLLHWLVAVIVITMLSLSFFLEDLPKASQPTGYMIHKSFGLTVLCLMLLRLVWIIHKGKPALPASVPRWEVIMTHIVQHSFYVLLLAMPICGWIMSVAAGRIPTFFGLFNVPLPIAENKPLAKIMDLSHKTIAWILIVLIVLHVAGVIKHYFFDRDRVLHRMLPGD